ncbi:S24 family peptidase [Azotobacter beijerinckii]|nr:S24 family peptidase [Azotobacter beijerinckii]
MDINQLRVTALKRLIGGMQLKEFAERHDLDASYLSQILNGHRKLGEKAAATLEEKLGLPSFALIYPREEAELLPGTKLEPQAFRRAPIKGIAQLGPDGYWDALEHADGWIDIPSSDPNAYSLRVKGDSMSPAIRDGWAVWCEPNCEPVPGEYVMVRRTNGQQMVKELLYANTESVSLMSVNASYGRLTIPRVEIEHIHPVGSIVPPSKIRY